MNLAKQKSMLFIMPRSSFSWQGAEGVWIMASGWASAAESVFGRAVVMTTDGLFTWNEILTFPKTHTGHPIQPNQYSFYRFFRKWVPEFLITLFKDIKLLMSKPINWPYNELTLQQKKDIHVVFERHDLYRGPGRKIADELQVPFVLLVDAPVIWEAKKWGVKRPFWGKLIETYIEAPSFRSADLIVCISSQIRNKLLQMGVAPGKIIICPNKVNAFLFHPQIDGSKIESTFHLKDKRVIGWVGSFRRFHGLETVLRAFSMINSKHTDTILMLVGEGQEKQRLMNLTDQLGLQKAVIFAGKHLVNEVPKFVVNFHLALVSAQSTGNFHYSPLKMYEYFATGRAVIAPSAGDLKQLFQDKLQVLFYEPGNIQDLAEKMELLLKDHDLRHKLEYEARVFAENEGTWDFELKKVCDRLGVVY